VVPTPEIAVLVHAYARREYLPSALRSISAQTLPRERYELLVSKSFDDPAIDRTLAEMGAVSLHDEDRWNSRCLHRAMRRSQAPIVTFLDDDDEYEPERLERILETMRAHPDVGLYRNRVRVIDGAGHPIPPERWRVHEQDVALDSLGPVHVAPDAKGDLLDLGVRRTSATFNSGTMAIRRELLDGDVGETFDEARMSMDVFLFLAAALSSLGLYLDDRRLTRFRFYAGNTTRETFWLGLTADSLRAMSALAARRGRRDFAEWLEGQSIHYERMFLGSTLMGQVAGGADRTEVARRAGGYLRFLGRNSRERSLDLDVWAAGGYGLAYALLPSLTRRAARARPTAWRAEGGASR
jgi:Glycosyl transferase family 2